MCIKCNSISDRFNSLNCNPSDESFRKVSIKTEETSRKRNSKGGITLK